MTVKRTRSSVKTSHYHHIIFGVFASCSVVFGVFAFLLTSAQVMYTSHRFRFIYLFRSYICIFSLLMLIVFVGAEVNIGLGKIAYQSSTVQRAVASRAVDGNTNARFGGGSCTHTARYQPSPWWMVDLGDHYTISSMHVYNRDFGGKCVFNIELKMSVTTDGLP